MPGTLADGTFTAYLFGWLVLLAISSGLLWLQRARRHEQAHRAIPESQPYPQKVNDRSPAEARRSRRRFFLEIALLLVTVSLYGSNFLALGQAKRLPGNETEVFQVLDWVLVHSVSGTEAFPWLLKIPLWNPYLHTGLPYIADPMQHAFNPLVTLPVLLFGVQNGFMLGVLLSFLVGAYGVWRIGVHLKLSPPVRLWLALMVTFAGQPTARFFQGQYLFVFGFAWIPWVVYSFFRLAEEPNRKRIAGAACSLALLFFSGNAYYAFFMLFVIGLIGLVMLVGLRSRQPFRISLDRERARAFLLAGILALGLVAAQLLPTIQFWPMISKSMDLEGSHTPGQIFLDYTSKDSERPDAYSRLPAKEEFYAYIGLWPFLALPFLLLMLQPAESLAPDEQVRRRRMALIFALLFCFVVVWINLDAMPWRQFFIETRWLLQFRHLLRILILGSLALLALAALGLDSLWRSLSSLSQLASSTDPAQVAELDPAGALMPVAPLNPRLAFTRKINPVLAQAGRWGVILFLVAGVVDLYETNSPILRPLDINQEMHRVANWLRSHQPGFYYVRANPVNSWHGAMLANGLPFMDAWYHFNNIRNPSPNPEQRPVQAHPNFIIQPVDHPEPPSPVQIIKQPEPGWVIYELTDSLPFTFAVSNSVLSQNLEKGELLREEVRALEPYLPGPNAIEVIVESPGEELLVALVTSYPGWQASVDGRAALLLDVNGYLGVELTPGVHKVVFAFRPTPFYLGLLISLVALGVIGYWLYADRWVDWRELVVRLGRLREWLYRLRIRWRRIWQPGWKYLQATYEGGVLIPAPAAEASSESPGATLLTEGAKFSLAVEAETTLRPIPHAARRWWWATLEFARVLVRDFPPGAGWFGAALGLYLLVRLIGLVQFPIYFFTDEAIQTLLAADFLRDGFKNAFGEFLPTYFKNVYQYNLSVSVYLQVIPYLLFGKSVFVTRLIPMLFTLLAAGSVGLILRNAFHLPYWWSATLLLSVMPAWFLHSRTAFEAPLMVSFYAAALLVYLRYRLVSPGSLYGALILFALAFYSYSPGQVVVVTTGLLLLFSDLRYHWQHREIALRGLGLLILLVVPYLRFRLNHPLAVEEHLSNLSSYWLQPLSFGEKLKTFLEEYRYGLSPQYWYIPNERDLPRHLMKGYGHLYQMTFPLLALGLLVALRNWRSAAHRVVLAAFLAAPVGGALVQVSITRLLVMVIPASLLAGLGVSTLLTWLERWRNWRGLYSLLLFGLLALANTNMLRNALVNGPTWYTNYGLGGMQYGAQQLFSEVNRYTAQNPEKTVVISTSWANGADVLATFFLNTETTRRSIRLGSIEQFIDSLQPLDPDMTVVMTDAEYQLARQSGKFAEIQVERVIPYPDGSPGFLFAHLQYIEDVTRLFEQEKLARRELLTDEIVIDGVPAQVRYSYLDMGNIQEVFDTDRKSVTRTREANPYVIEVIFSEPRQIRGLSIVIGSTEAILTVQVTPPGGQSVQYQGNLFGSIEFPESFLDFGEIILAQSIKIELKDLRQAEPAHVHIWEIFLH